METGDEGTRTSRQLDGRMGGWKDELKKTQQYVLAAHILSKKNYMMYVSKTINLVYN